MNVDQLVKTDLRSDWRKFSKWLFRLEDADPGYMLLRRADISRAQKLRYVLGWCTFYNPGLAARASDFQGPKFYEFLRYVYPHAKRAPERRHFRGQAGLRALDQWQRRYPNPEAMVEACFGGTYMDIRRNMSDMAQMGDYFYWKLADIQDTVMGMPVDFAGSERYMPQLPKQGAALIYGHDTGIVEEKLTQPDLVYIMGEITDHITKFKHPFSDRGLLLQEAETVACVFKQHNSGSYKPGFRSAKAYRRLKAVVNETPTAQKLLDGLYAGGIWDEGTLVRVGEYL